MHACANAPTSATASQPFVSRIAHSPIETELREALRAANGRRDDSVDRKPGDADSATPRRSRVATTGSRSPGSWIFLRRALPRAAAPVVALAFVPSYSGGGRAGFTPASLVHPSGHQARGALPIDGGPTAPASGVYHGRPALGKADDNRRRAEGRAESHNRTQPFDTAALVTSVSKLWIRFTSSVGSLTTPSASRA